MSLSVFIVVDIILNEGMWVHEYSSNAIVVWRVATPPRGVPISLPGLSACQ